MSDADGLSRLRLGDAERNATQRRRWRGPLALVALAVAAVIGGVAMRVWPRRGDPAVRASDVTASPTNPAARAATAPSSDGVLMAGGHVEAGTRVALALDRTGVIAQVRVHRGDHVRRGEVLLELDARAEQAEVEVRRAALASAEARLAQTRAGARSEEVAVVEQQLADAEAALQLAHEQSSRASTLQTHGAVTAAEAESASTGERRALAQRDAARARLALLRAGSRGTEIRSADADTARARAELSAAEARLAAMRLTAPIDGTVVLCERHEGEAVVQGDATPLLVLADLDRLLVKVDVPEINVASVRVGMLADVTVEGLPTRAFHARVREIALEADRQRNTVEVTLELTEHDPDVRPQMSARASIHRDQTR